MAGILITGMSGTGKSSVLNELARRGYRTVDSDEPGWKEERDGEWVWREDRIAALLTSCGQDVLFVSGCVANQGRFYPSFRAVVLLSAPADVIAERVAQRTTNDFGKSHQEMATILTDLITVEPLLRASCTHEIDTTLPLDVVVRTLLDIAAG